MKSQVKVGDAAPKLTFRNHIHKSSGLQKRNIIIIFFLLWEMEDEVTTEQKVNKYNPQAGNKEIMFTPQRKT